MQNRIPDDLFKTKRAMKMALFHIISQNANLILTEFICILTMSLDK